MSAIKRALLLSTGDRYFALVTNFATVSIVSRILSPGEIGVSVIGAAIVGIVLSIKEFASSNFLIQRGELSRNDIRSTFTVMLILTLAIAAALLLAAPWLASAYEEPQLAPYLRLVSVALLVELISTQILALLRRDMVFGKVAITNMAGAAAGSISTIVLALLGFSYMSFAWAWLASATAMALFAIVFRPHFWMFKPSLRHWREMVAFGGYHGATVVLLRAYEALPYLLLGRMFSPDATGLLSRANMICQLPDKLIIGGAVPVVLPAFATEVRQGRDLKHPYLKAIELVTALQWPALVCLALLAHPVIHILLGPQWKDVVPLVQVMAIASLFAFSFELNYPVLVSMGAISDIFRRALIIFPVSAAMIGAASFFGLQAVASSFLLVIPFQAFVSMLIVRRRIAMQWADIAAPLWRSSVVTATTALGPLAVIMATGFRLDLPIWQGIFAGCLAGAGWVMGLKLTRHPLFDELLKTLSLRRFAVQQLREMP
ncbi:oligosaccharide flippase family protein [Mesorhizobium sp. KR2-14]|uniref:oligosaccharide flippase family protein n=1 Tax=Mesorhizobium sp. KR2-14 TaxID=3156610 RepID=UPI0032B3D8FC